MKHRFTLAQYAQEDLQEIWSYLATENLEAADALIDSIFEKLEMVSQNPLMGRKRDEIRAGLRSIVVKRRYLALYYFIEGEIKVSRVVHTSRNLEGLFGDE